MSPPWLRKILNGGIMAVTITDIAKKLGVAHCTISRGLRKDPRISDRMTARIINTAKRMGYIPNLLARGLVEGKTGTVAVLVPATNVEITAMKIMQLEKCMADNGLDMFLSFTHGCLENAIDIATKLQARGIDGMLVLSHFCDTNHNQVNPAPLWKSRTPTVFLDSLLPIDNAHVYLDRGAGMQQAVEYLFSLGHRDVFLFTPAVMLNEPRVRTFIKSMNDAGLSGLEHCCIIDDSAKCKENRACFSAEAIFSTVTCFLQRHPECTAIMCTSDMMALTVQTALHSMGIRIPRNISLVGFDNITAGLSCFPQLTTISQPVEKLAAQAVKMLLAMMEDETVRPDAVSIPTELVVRKSTGIPRNTIAKTMRVNDFFRHSQ